MDLSNSELDDDTDVEQKTQKNDGKLRLLTENAVIEWLYSTGFPQYVDMYQSNFFEKIFDFYF